MSDSARRRVATVLMLDIVGSTTRASELGDARWREALTRFRRIVRGNLKRFDGREQDTAGDGFFAIFAEPTRALRAAASIVDDVQALGLDVRVGVHTGECEEIDGKLGGIAVHLAARIMGLAGAGEVYVTSTVRDLVSGSGAVFDDRGEHALKGVEGKRGVLALAALDTPLPPPLSREQSAQRLALIEPSTTSPRLKLALAAGGIVLIGAAIATPLLTLRGNAKAASPPALLRLDAGARKIDSAVSAGPTNRGAWANLWSVDGTLWQFVGGNSPAPRLVARDLTTGTVEQSTTLPQGSCSCRLAFGFGSIWAVGSRVAVSGPKAGTPQTTIERFDELSGRQLRSVALSGGVDYGTIAVGNGAVWVLENDGTLVRVDPVTNRVTNTYGTRAIETNTLIPLAGYEWICECVLDKVMRFDARTDTSRTFDIPAQAYLIGVDSLNGQTLWLLDPKSATLTAMNPSSGRAEPPLGLAGEPQQAVVAFGAVWVAAGRVVDRLDLGTKTRSVIQMPRGVWAGSIAADPAGRSIWIGNSGSAPPAN